MFNPYFSKMRNSLYNLFIITALSAFFTHCKKSTLPDDAADPVVFEIEADVDGKAEKVSTDIAQGHYMYTSFGMDTATNVMVLNGTLAQANCPSGDCPGSLRFEFRNIAMGNNVNINELLPNSEYLYTNTANIGQGKTEYTLNLEAQPPGGISNIEYFWEVLGIGTFQGNPVTVQLPSAEDRTIMLSCDFVNGVSRVTRTITVDTSVVANPLPRVGISLLLDSQQITASAFPFQPDQKYVWMTGDSTQFIKTKMTVSEFFVTATSKTTQKSANAQFIVSAPLSTNKPIETIDFKERITKTITPGSLELGKVAIQWVSRDGVIWRSDRGAQVADNFFFTKNSSLYLTNENGQKTYKVFVEFRCNLFNNSGQFIPILGSGVIALAYP